MNRCRNCGILDHKTQHCPRYGPWYPEPGKTREDYAALADEITEKVAQDILAEHEGHDHEDPTYSVRSLGRPSSTKRISVQDREALTRACEACQAPQGQWCTTSAGRQADRLHKGRFIGEEQEYGHVQPAGTPAS